MIRDFIFAHFMLMLELGGLLVGMAMVIGVAGVLISRFDDIRLEDAIYFAFITASTVGFGDVVPKSRGARIVAVILSFIGLILIGVAVAVSVHALDIALQSGNG